jgi:uncharacterized membrane protein
LDRLFEIGVVLKGLDGLLELLCGLTLLLITPAQVETLAGGFATSVLSNWLPDTVAGWAVTGAERLTVGGLAFGAAYLLVHGVVKVALVLALLRNQLWAYPLMIAVLLGFVGVQVYELVVSPSIALAGLTLFDVAVIGLTVREYRRQRLGPPGGGEKSGPESAQVGLSIDAPS